MNLLDLAREALAEAGSNRPSEANASHRWRVTTPAGATMEVLFVPPATAAEAAEVYPGSAVAPILERPSAPNGANLSNGADGDPARVPREALDNRND